MVIKDTPYNPADQQMIQAAEVLDLTFAEFIEAALLEKTERTRDENGCSFCHQFLSRAGRCFACDDDKI